MEPESENFDNEMESELLILRLQNGTDLIGLCVDVQDDMDADHYIISVPFVITTFQDRKTRLWKIGFKPWFWDAMVNNTEPYKIYTQDVLTTAEPSESLTDSYMMAYKAYTESIKISNVLTPVKNTTQEILDTMDRLEPSIDNNKNVKKFVKSELRKLTKPPGK